MRRYFISEKSEILGWISYPTFFIAHVRSVRRYGGSVGAFFDAPWRTKRRMRHVASGVSLVTVPVMSGDNWKAAAKTRLYLTCVPIIWATYSPTVRFLYQFQGVAPSAALVNVGPAAIGALVYLLPFAWRNWFVKSRSAKDLGLDRISIRMGVELGLYMFAGSVLQVLALQLTTAAQVGCLLQLSMIFTFMIERAGTKKSDPDPRHVVSSRWSARQMLGIVGALMGTVLLTIDEVTRLQRPDVGEWDWRAILSSLDANPLSSSLSHSALLGQCLSVCSAATYALYAVRLAHPEIGTRRAYSTALVKTFILGFLSIVWFLQSPNSASDTMFFRVTGSYGMMALIGSSLWNGIVGTAVVTWLQFKGQTSGHVSPSEASILYGTAPLWGAFFAWLFLHETFGPVGLFGAAALLISTLSLNIAMPAQSTESESEGTPS